VVWLTPRFANGYAHQSGQEARVNINTIPDSRFPIPYSLLPMSKDLPYIVPSPQPEAEEVFAVHQTSQEFYQEVNVRLEFKQHCEWYQKTATQNRRDLGKMRRELNIMSWFCRR